MILETKEEKQAFEFVCSLAEQATERICNDLDKGYIEMFKGLKVDGEDIDGSTIQREIVFDFDVLHWLKGRVKDGFDEEMGK